MYEGYGYPYPTMILYNKQGERADRWISNITSDNKVYSIQNRVKYSQLIDKETNEKLGMGSIEENGRLFGDFSNFVNVNATFSIDCAMASGSAKASGEGDPRPEDLLKSTDHSDKVKRIAFVYYCDDENKGNGLPKLGDLVVTVNEEIIYATETTYEYDWASTGELFDKPDYLKMINDLEARIEALENS